MEDGEGEVVEREMERGGEREAHLCGQFKPLRD